MSASKFSPITLPELETARLQHAVLADGVQHRSTDFELHYDSTPMLFLYPHEAKLMRTVTVKNGGQYASLQVYATVSGGRLGLPAMPNVLYLEPGELQLIWVTAYMQDLDQSAWHAGGSYDYEIDVYVTPDFGPFNPSAPGLGAKIARLANTVRVVSTRIDGNDVPRNATVSGCVYDTATRKPLPNAQITFASTSFKPESATADAKGSYRVDLIADKGALTGMWRPWGVTVKAPGYREFHRALAPKDGDHVVLDAPLAKATETASYTLKTKIDTSALNIVAGAISRDGKYLATVPYHSFVPPGTDAQQFLNQAQLSFFDTAGVLLWQFPLYNETFAVAISDDGSLVATSRAQNPGRPAWRSDTGVYLLDRKGNVVWYFRDPTGRDLPFYEVRISHNKRYLAAGNLGGQMYLLDITKQSVVWQRFLGGSVRELHFDDDDGALYAGAEGGYLYAFGIDGSVKWRTYVGGFPIGHAFSDHHIATAGKEGAFVSLLDRSGKLLWEYPVATAPVIAIAPDESYIIAEGRGVGFRSIALSPSGELLYQLDPVAQVPYITSDSKHIVRVGPSFNKPSDPETTIWVELTDRTGSVLWHADSVGSTVQGQAGGFAWLSDDAKHLVVAFGESVYFFEGSITTK